MMRPEDPRAIGIAVMLLVCALLLVVLGMCSPVGRAVLR